MSQKIYKVTQEIYKALKNGQIVTDANDNEYSFDPTALYTIIDATELDYRLGVEENEIVLFNNGAIIDKITPNFAEYAALAERDSQGNTIYDSYIRWDDVEHQNWVSLPNISTGQGSIESTFEDYPGLVIRTNDAFAILDLDDAPYLEFINNGISSTGYDEIKLFGTENRIINDWDSNELHFYIDDSMYFNIISSTPSDQKSMLFVSDEGAIDSTWHLRQQGQTYFYNDVWFDSDARFEGTTTFTGSIECGNIITDGDITPHEDLNSNLGLSTARYKNTHSQYIFTDYLLPPSGWTGVIGQANQPFHSLYVSNIYENGEKLDNKYASKTMINNLQEQINEINKNAAQGGVVSIEVPMTGPYESACIIEYLIKNDLIGTFVANNHYLCNNEYLYSNYCRTSVWDWRNKVFYNTLEPYNVDTVPSSESPSLYNQLEVLNVSTILEESADLKNQVDILYKEVQNMKYTNEGITFNYITDESVAYEKTTPLKIGPYAAVEKVSGISYGRDNLIDKPDVVIVNGWNCALTKRDANMWRVTCSAAGTTSGYYSSVIRIPIKYFNRNKRYRFKCDSFAASSTNIPRIIIRYYDAEGALLGNLVEVNKDSASPLTMDTYKNFVDMTTMQSYWDQISYVGVTLYASSGAECPSGSYVNYKGLYIGEDNEVNIYNPQPTEIISIGQNLFNLPTEMRSDLSYSINCQGGRIYFSGQAKSTGNIVWNLEQTLPPGDYTVSLFNPLNSSNEKKIIYGLVTKSPTEKYIYYTPQGVNEYRNFHSDYEVTGFFIGVNELGLDLTQAEFYPMITKGHDFKPSEFKLYAEYHKEIPQEVLDQLTDYGLSINDTINNYIDLENKKYIRQCGFFKYDANKHTISLVDENDSYVRFKIANILDPQGSNTINGKLITNWSNIPPYTNYTEYANKTYEQISAQNMNLFVVIKKTNASTADEFKTYLANHPFAGVYQLKQYEEIDLSSWLTDDEFLPVEENGTIFIKNTTNLYNLVDNFVTPGQKYGPSYGLTWTYDGNGQFTGTGILTGNYPRWGFGKLNTGVYYWNYENANRYIRLYRINEDSSWTYFAPYNPVVIERDNTTVGFIFNCSDVDLNTEEPITFTSKIMLIEGTGHPLQTMKTTDFDVLSTITYTQKVG